MFRKPDRRITNTKNKLHGALLDLTTKQKYESISVKDITTKANVGRSTFYSHFEQKDELLLSRQNEIFKDANKHRNKRDINLFLIEIYTHLNHHKEDVKVIANDKSGDLMLERLSFMIEDYFEHETQKTIVSSELRSLIGKACSSSIIGLAKGWIEEGQKIKMEILIERSTRIFQLHKNLLSNKNAI